MKALNAFQRTLERLPLKGKGRLGNFIVETLKPTQLECHPVRDVTILLRPNHSIERWMWAGAYERPLVDLVKTLLCPGMTMLDIGANIGYFSAIAAALVGNNGCVHAFEPVSDTFMRLELNLEPFPWAHAYHTAVGDNTGVATIHFNQQETGWGSLLPNYDLPLSESIGLIRLDDWFARGNVCGVDFVKIDVEGQEYRVLQGAAGMLRSLRPTIAAELNAECLKRDAHTPEVVLQLLRSAGYLASPFNNGVLAIPEEKQAVLSKLRPYISKPFSRPVVNSARIL